MGISFNVKPMGLKTYKTLKKCLSKVSKKVNFKGLSNVNRRFLKSLGFEVKK